MSRKPIVAPQLRILRTPPWQDYLSLEEAERLNVIRTERLSLAREARRIFDRARKRVQRAKRV
jgi:hypothetical protein